MQLFFYNFNLPVFGSWKSTHLAVSLISGQSNSDDQVVSRVYAG
jgi:hypothetical protein